ITCRLLSLSGLALGACASVDTVHCPPLIHPKSTMNTELAKNRVFIFSFLVSIAQEQGFANSLQHLPRLAHRPRTFPTPPSLLRLSFAPPAPALTGSALLRHPHAN